MKFNTAEKRLLHELQLQLRVIAFKLINNTNQCRESLKCQLTGRELIHLLLFHVISLCFVNLEINHWQFPHKLYSIIWMKLILKLQTDSHILYNQLWVPPPSKWPTLNQLLQHINYKAACLLSIKSQFYNRANYAFKKLINC